MTGEASGNADGNSSESARAEPSARGGVGSGVSDSSSSADGVVAATVGRLVNKVDFEKMLAAPARSRSTHFAVHHVASKPSLPVWRHRKAEEEELSTAHASVTDSAVDELQACHWLGTVVPKRHARRSVTRSLLKRQIREALASHAGRLPPGLWLVRLRSSFAPSQFPSAASLALRRAARAELDQLLTTAGR